MYLALDTCLYPLVYIFKNYDILPNVMTFPVILAFEQLRHEEQNEFQATLEHIVNFMPQSEIQWALLKKNKDQTKKFYHSIVLTEIDIFM